MNTLTVDGKLVTFSNDDRNLLEVIRKANIELPTFCYHSELSVYGACRLCLVEIEGRGLNTACTTKPEPNLVVRTNTAQLRDIRKFTIELLLASYEHDCTTCSKSTACKLQDIAKRLGVTKVRFKRGQSNLPIDDSSWALVRDPNKCILCGDCVRACEEIQGIGAIDFAWRGANTHVVPAFNKGLAHVDCVDCGQCSRVCPTGAIVPRSQIDAVWKELDNPEKTVVVHFAPAVRVAIGEAFGMPAGTVLPGQIASALRTIGFDKIYDTSFTADLTIMEEATELVGRIQNGGVMPMFTSCCPAWVKYMEQYYPEMLPNLSTCKSPMGMFGAVAKSYLPDFLNIDPKNLVVVTIMPCTAKKVEAKRPEFTTDGMPDNDYVLTTQEFATMIKQSGIRFQDLSPEPFDLPFGYKTGAGVIFGNTGGVMEAALRYAVEIVEGKPLSNLEFNEVRGEEGIREINLTVGELELKIAVVHGLKNAKKVVQDIKEGRKIYHFVEVMTCPGGCIGGAGQPVYFDKAIRTERIKGLYSADKMLQMQKSQENPYIQELYKNFLGEVGGEKAHKLLHTHYYNRKRISEEGMSILENVGNKLSISVCVGTNCFMKGSQEILKRVLNFIESKNLTDFVEVKANFCMENCDKGPSVSIGNKVYSNVSFDNIVKEIEAQLEAVTK
ncbi:MAG: 4Fe-4S binding protein [Ignavibacteria bacterium]|jgi:NADH-quinone oxidoreductase subunit G|nr:4Fe-4S binding protein [Ignavibacteria bacterium]